MEPMDNKDFIVGPDDPILVTGASGFIGPRVVEALLHRGFRNLRCFVRPSSRPSRIEALNAYGRDGARIDLVEGDLLCPEDCTRASKDVMVVFHLAAGTGEASFPDAFMNSVVTTRNLLDACLQHRCLSRFVNISSFAVYTNIRAPRWRHARSEEHTSELQSLTNL